MSQNNHQIRKWRIQSGNRRDTDCKNWLDRKQSNKKERQAGLQYVREVKLKVGALKIDRTIPKIYVDEH